MDKYRGGLGVNQLNSCSNRAINENEIAIWLQIIKTFFPLETDSTKREIFKYTPVPMVKCKEPRLGGLFTFAP